MRRGETGCGGRQKKKRCRFERRGRGRGERGDDLVTVPPGGASSFTRAHRFSRNAAAATGPRAKRGSAHPLLCLSVCLSALIHLAQNSRRRSVNRLLAESQQADGERKERGGGEETYTACCPDVVSLPDVRPSADTAITLHYGGIKGRPTPAAAKGAGA